LFGKEAGYEALQKHIEGSKLAVEKKNIRETLRPVIVQAIPAAKDVDDFRLLLKKKNVGVLFRKNEAGRIYGVTFMDYQNRFLENAVGIDKRFQIFAHLVYFPE
jgi:hypothetical protein